jgi:anti-anti-sigma factor
MTGRFDADPDPQVDVGRAEAQIKGIDRLLSRSHEPLPPAAHREQKFELDRLREAVLREVQAARDRAAQHLAQAPEGTWQQEQPRVVLAHRNEWFRSRISAALTARGVTVVGDVDNGADASGVTTVEQPDLLVLEDRLPSFTGPDVIRRVKETCPGLLVAVQVLDDSFLARALEAGADATFGRSTAAPDIADLLVQLLADRPPRRPVPPEVVLPFWIEHPDSTGRTVIRLCGELDIAETPFFEAVVTLALADQPVSLTLDATPLAFIDSSGTRALSSAARASRAAGVEFAVVAPPGKAVRRLLDLLQMHLAMTVWDALPDPRPGDATVPVP